RAISSPTPAAVSFSVTAHDAGPPSVVPHVALLACAPQLQGDSSNRNPEPKPWGTGACQGPANRRLLMVVGAGQTGDDRTGGTGVLRVVVSVEAAGRTLVTSHGPLEVMRRAERL